MLTCSALKKSYRDSLRAAVPALQFAFLEITPAEAQRRVTARSASHFFSASLVNDQFATLESPVGEARVLQLDATESLASLTSHVMTWLNRQSTHRSSPCH